MKSFNCSAKGKPLLPTAFVCGIQGIADLRPWYSTEQILIITDQLNPLLKLITWHSFGATLRLLRLVWLSVDSLSRSLSSVCRLDDFCNSSRRLLLSAFNSLVSFSSCCKILAKFSLSVFCRGWAMNEWQAKSKIYIKKARSRMMTLQVLKLTRVAQVQRSELNFPPL